MKKLLLLFCMIAFASFTKAQEWAPLGATWHYSASTWYQGYESYIEITSVGDTVIDGITCKILSHTGGGEEYTYLDSSNVVHYYRFGQFYTLYDFNATVGKSWTIAGDNVFGCDSIGEIQVDSIGTTSINGYSLKYIVLSQKDSSTLDFGYYGVEAIERIGGLYSLFPIVNDNCIISEMSYGLRCYYDSTIGLYETGIASSCTYTSVKDISLNENDVKIYPNPASSEINIEIENLSGSNYILETYSTIGQKLSSRIMNDNLVSISTENLSNGSYLVLIRKEDGTVVFDKLVEVSH